jgi:orotidine-5'-phosphate decarboxylase
MTILDYKRNDIASTAEAYAEAGLGGMRVGNQLLSVWDADAVTVNPYLGRESVEPFLACARRSGRGVFILARTSNPGASQFQNLVCDGKPLFLHVAQAIGEWSRENLGNCGYGDVGAVVGATRPQELALIRAHVPEAIFLLPGFGVQGATAADTAAAFDKLGLGAVVNSARGITFCFEPADPEWEAKVVLATKKAIADLAEKTSMSRLAL